MLCYTRTCAVYDFRTDFAIRTSYAAYEIIARRSSSIMCNYVSVSTFRANNFSL